MKVLWIQDFNTKQHKGGAQQTNEVMIQVGLKKGHEINVITYEDKLPDNKEYDVTIVNNMTKFAYSDIEHLKRNKCVRYEHDYWLADNYKDSFKGYKHSIFLSPLHYETTVKKVGYNIEDYSILPSPIDSKLFNTKDRDPIKNTVAVVGNMCELKGLNEFMVYLESNPSTVFNIVGWGETEALKKYPNVKIYEQMSLKNIARFYKRNESFYHRPLWNEPFGRTVVEAYLCGCNLICNSNVGALSYGWDFNDYDKIKREVNTSNKFWKIIENV